MCVVSWCGDKANLPRKYQTITTLKGGMQYGLYTSCFIAQNNVCLLKHWGKKHSYWLPFHRVWLLSILWGACLRSQIAFTPVLSPCLFEGNVRLYTSPWQASTKTPGLPWLTAPKPRDLLCLGRTKWRGKCWINSDAISDRKWMLILNLSTPSWAALHRYISLFAHEHGRSVKFVRTRTFLQPQK